MRSLAIGVFTLLSSAMPTSAEHPCVTTRSTEGPPKYEIVQPRTLQSGHPNDRQVDVAASSSTPGTNVRVSEGRNVEPGNDAKPVVVPERTWKRVDCE